MGYALKIEVEAANTTPIYCKCFLTSVVDCGVCLLTRGEALETRDEAKLT